MTALMMRAKLAQLKRAHAVTTLAVTVPLSPHTEYSQVLSGRATTLDLDLARQKFRGWAFGNIALQDLPPLYYKHDASREVGNVTSLAYDKEGALTIVARVDDPIARRCNSFSVGATVLEYSILDADSPSGFHAIIRRARIEEISLTETPANPNATVTHRRDVSAQAEFWGAAAAAMARISNILTQLQKETQHGLPIG
jgi:hypothetical protein